MNEYELDRIADLVAKKLGYLNKQYFSTKEAADYLGLAVKSVYKLYSDGIIKARKPNGKCLVFDRSVLDKYLQKNKQ